MKCAVCGDGRAGPPGVVLPLCARCDVLWWASAERAKAAKAKEEFVERMRKERKTA